MPTTGVMEARVCSLLVGWRHEGVHYWWGGRSFIVPTASVMEDVSMNTTVVAKV